METSIPKLPAIARPNGKMYRPRRITPIPLGSEEEIVSIIVFGTHDARFAEGHAKAEADRLANEFYGGDYRLEITGPGEPVWYRQDLSHFEDGAARYTFEQDPGRGRAGVRFSVEEVEVPL